MFGQVRSLAQPLEPSLEGLVCSETCQIAYECISAFTVTSAKWSVARHERPLPRKARNRSRPRPTPNPTAPFT